MPDAADNLDEERQTGETEKCGPADPRDHQQDSTTDQQQHREYNFSTVGEIDDPV